MKTGKLAAITVLALCQATSVLAQRIEKAPQTGLDSAWDWALTSSSARNDAGGFWVGFAFPRLMRENTFIMGGGGWMMVGGSFRSRGVPLADAIEQGRMQTGDARFAYQAGVLSPEKLVQKRIAVLVGYGPRSRSRWAADKIKIGDMSLPFDLAGRPLVWLGEVSSDDCLNALLGLYRTEQPEKVREELVQAVALQDSPEPAIAFLERVIADDPASRVRKEAVEGLGRQPEQRSVAVLARVALNDAESSIRKEAAESLGRIPLESAEAALIRIARSDADVGVRVEAVESLRKSPSQRTADALAEIAFEADSVRVEREAAETLGRFPKEMALPVLRRIAETHPVPDVQREAAESLGRFPDREAMAILVGILHSSSASERVQRQAVESMARYPDEMAVAELIDAAESHPSQRVRREAIESLAKTASQRAVQTLSRLANQDYDLRVQRQAIRSLIELRDGSGTDIVIRLARSHPNLKVRQLAIEALGKSDDPRAHKALIDIVKGQ